MILNLELISVDGENLDVAGCLVGPSGERVCPLGAFGADGQSRVQFRGNKVNVIHKSIKTF